MKILACYSNKGGVGKTASAVNLAYLCAQAGYRTLLCDLDAQGAASFYLRVKAAKKGEEIPLLTAEDQLAVAIRGSDYDNLDLLPAGIAYRNFDILLFQMKRKRSRLKKALQSLGKEYQVVLLDCPPNLSLLSDNIFKAADAIVVPVIPTTLSVRTLDQLHALFADCGYRKKKLVPFCSMAQLGKKLHRETMTALQKKQKGLLQSYIPFSSEIEKMGVHRAPLLTYAAKDPASTAYRELWTEIEVRLKLRKPVTEQEGRG
jgi:chromosome partitioning protein